MTFLSFFVFLIRMEEIVTELNYLPLYDLPGLPTNKEVIYRYLALINPNRLANPNKKLGSQARNTLIDEIFETARVFREPILSRSAVAKRLKTLLSKRENAFKWLNRSNAKSIADRDLYLSLLDQTFEMNTKERPGPLSLTAVSSSDSDFDTTFASTSYSHLIDNEEIVYPPNEEVISPPNENVISPPNEENPAPSTSQWHDDYQIQSRLACLETIERRRITQDQFQQEIFANSAAVSVEQATTMKEDALKKLEMIANSVNIESLPKNVVDALISAKQTISANVETLEKTSSSNSNPFLSLKPRRIRTPVSWPAKKTCFGFSPNQIRNVWNDTSPNPEIERQQALFAKYSDNSANLASFSNSLEPSNQNEMQFERLSSNSLHSVTNSIALQNDSLLEENETEENLFESFETLNNENLFSNEMLLSPQTIDELDQISRTIVTRSQSSQIDAEDLSSNESQNENEEEYFPSSSQNFNTSNEEKIDIFDQDFISILDRFNVSNRAATAIVAGVLSRLERVLNISLGNILCSVSTVHRRRQTGRELIVEKIKQSALSEDYITLHWDGIKTQALQGPSKVHRLIVTLSGKSNKELFMGASICEESAAPIANFIQQQLAEWRLLNKIKALCFDTTYTNSGQRGGVVAFFIYSKRFTFLCMSASYSRTDAYMDL